MALDRISPIGHARTDYGFAMVAHLVAAAFSGRGSCPDIETFLPFAKAEEQDPGPPKSRSEAKRLAAELIGWAKGLGATVTPKR